MNTAHFVLVSTGCLSLVACGSSDNSRIVGQLESDRIEITAELFEPIVDIAVAEGQQVSAGDLLLRQDDSRVREKIRETEAALGQAQARLDELVRGPRKEQIDAARANVDGARRDLAFQKAEYERAKRVFERDLAAADTVDRARAEFDRAGANLEFQQARLQELLSGTTVEELEQAERAVEQMDARLAALKIDLERHRAVAPVDAIVDSRLYETGEKPTVGQPMLILLSGAQPYARIYIPESLRVRVVPGTRAIVHVDGLSEALDGRVRWVASEAAFTPYFALTEHDRGRLTYLAKVDIQTTAARLPDGVPVEVELLLDRAPK